MRILRDRFRRSRVELWVFVAMVGMGWSSLLEHPNPVNTVEGLLGGWFGTAHGVGLIAGGVGLLVLWLAQVHVMRRRSLLFVVLMGPLMVHFGTVVFHAWTTEASWLAVFVHGGWYLTIVEVVRKSGAIDVFFMELKKERQDKKRLLHEVDELRRGA